MRPRDFCTQRQKSVRAERNGALEASAEFTASVGRGAARKGETQASADHVCLSERGYVEGLRLHGRIGGDSENRPVKMITGLSSSAIAVRIEVRRKSFEPGHVTVRPHPVLRIAERGGEISGAEIGDAVHACLEHVAVPAPESLRDAPVGAAAAERKTHYGIGRQLIIETGGTSTGAGGKVMGADPNGITGSAAGGAIAAAPHGPALLEGCQRSPRHRLLVHRRIGGGEVGRAAETGPALDERVPPGGRGLGHVRGSAPLRAGHGFSGYGNQKTSDLTTRKVGGVDVEIGLSGRDA